MKKQRIQNPRFLAALGFFGFLGLLGFDNPEVQRWAKLSWLSVLSLLVLLPTVNVESKQANYRLNPRRKGLLAFLVFLPFLGFLGTGYESLVGVAWLSMVSQFAIDQKKRTSAVPLRAEIIIGIIFVGATVLFIALGLAKIWMVVMALTLPVSLALAPVFDIKERLPLRELRWIALFLVMAVIFPVGGMTWFMTAAMRNERAAVKQQMLELQKSQLASAASRLNDEFLRLKDCLEKQPELSAPEQFCLLVQRRLGDSILVLSEDGSQFSYPESEWFETEVDASPEGLELKTRVLGLIRSKNWTEAKALLEQMEDDETLRVACDSSGRAILPALLLFYAQSNPADTGMLGVLRSLVLDYSLPMPSVRRLFYLMSLAELGVDVMPWLHAEQIAQQASAYAKLPDFVDDSGFTRLQNADLWMLPNAEAKTAIIFRESTLVEHFQLIVDSAVVMKNVRMVLSRKRDRMASEVNATWSGWYVNLYLDGDHPFSEEMDRRILVYILTGIGLIVFISVAAALLVRSLVAQQRLTHMKNDFVATVTHELKTPLASTRMLVDTLLEGRCKSESQQREYLELIARENKRLSRLIDNFLTFSRMERNKRSLHFEDVAPGELVHIAVETVHENYEQCGCSLTVEIAENPPPILADRDSMVQVLLNLLDNACKYSDGDKCIRLRVFEKEQAVCFEVADNGIGMTAREQSKIFDRFYQVDQSMTRKVGGAGLGLSIVNFIVGAHGGKIDIESELGSGSVFTVRIPLNGDS
ncbi:Alkaline phosphatase synthesis sensor protein PhoR [Pontiella desulfatans]|uniref:histidine kinase n=1 Tax=Pontiella desulfatans TaxID=2750659 RepID=A0A6C2UEH2_PONDE|nr:HAMP domain-containing sensor histidine kinase [Pontiella desulfatans]VGO17927.1 Alkaline phosphatase synthesis sensor protein PhoR [Pontiella desulfatans]